MIPSAPRILRAGLLLLGSLALPATADGRPLLREPSLGTGAAAFAGGGAGHAGGVNAVFANPGALDIPSGSQVEAGMMGLSEGLSPYALFGARSGAWSYALGSFHDIRVGPFRSGVLGGAAREFAPGAAVGAAVRSQGGAAGFGVDADVGMRLRARDWAFLGDWAVLGLAVRNLAESGVGRKPEGYRTLRSYALSLGARRDALRLPFLPLREPDASYELRAEGPRPEGLSHILSAGAGFTPSGALALRGSVRLPHEGRAVMAVGGFLSFAVGAGGLRCGYTLATGGIGTGTGEGASSGGSAPTHALSVNVALGARSDRQPPWVSVRADRVFLGAEAPGKDRVHFRLQAADRTVPVSGAEDGMAALAESPGAAGTRAIGEAYAGGRGELREWELAIHATGRDGRKQGAVRIFRGKDLPPRLIRWDGRDDGGRALAPGYYAFRLTAQDKAGNRAETSWQLVEVGRVPEGGAGGDEGPAPRGPARAEPAGHSTEGPMRLPDIIEGDDG